MARRTTRGGCPICRKAATPDYAPFCSKRCADVDLGRWLGGGYAIPAEEPPPFDAGDPGSPGSGQDEADLEAMISNDNAPSDPGR